MAELNLLIEPAIINGELMDSTTRAMGISQEIARIVIPINNRPLNYTTQYMFGWVKHPSLDKCILKIDTDCPLYPHSEHDASALIALLPNTPLLEKEGLEAFLKSTPIATFGQILPTQRTILTDAQLDADGWNNI